MKERGMMKDISKALAMRAVRIAGLETCISEREAFSIWCENTDSNGNVNVDKFVKDCQEFAEFLAECNSDSYDVELSKIDNSWKTLSDSDIPF